MHVAGWAFALGSIAAICGLAAVCSIAAMKRTYERARKRIPEWAAGLVAAFTVLVTFFLGGWLIIALWWTATRSVRLVHRLVG
jgi:hypothetical protein